MKRRFNLFALVVLVSVNVFTPVSYAQKNPETEEGIIERQELIFENLADGADTENNEAESQNSETEENIEEPETPSSAMDIISAVVEEYKEAQKEEPEADGENKVEESNNPEEITAQVEEDVVESANLMDAANEGVVETMEEGAKTSQDGCFTYNVLDEGNKEIEIVSYSENCPKFVNLSNGIDGYDVISIANRAFYRKGITGVIIGDMVERVGEFAFQDGGRLEYLKIGKKVNYLGYNAFDLEWWDYDEEKERDIAYYTDVEFSDGFDFDALEVDNGQDNITWFKIKGGENECFVFDFVEKQIYSYVCTDKIVTIPEKLYGYDVKSVYGHRGRGQEGAFSDKGVKLLILPDTIQNIGEAAACHYVAGVASMADIAELQDVGSLSLGSDYVGVKPYTGQSLSSELTNEMLNEACMYISEEHTVKFYDENGDLIKEIMVDGYINFDDVPLVEEREGFKYSWINQYGEAYNGELVTEDLMLTLKYKKEGILHEDGIIKVSDGEHEVWLRDRNVGAERVYLDNLVNNSCIVTYTDGGLCVESDDVDCDDRTSYTEFTCSDEFYDKVSNIVGVKIMDSGELKNYLKDSQLSFGNYYFWGNNGYATYDEMNFNNGYSTGISKSAEERGFLRGGKMDVENTGWEEGKANNPCDTTKGEYLPTSEDRVELMQIWTNLNDTELSSHQTVGNLGTSEGNLGFKNYSDYSKFANDMLLPNAGSIRFSPIDPNTCMYNLEVQGCRSNDWYYKNYSSLWTARDDLGSIGEYSVDEGSIYWSQSLYSNNYAHPVRCFMVANPVTVTFEENGGSSVESYKVPEGSTISEPTPTKAGYTLEGWYTSDGEKWDFENDVVEGDMTLYAQWRVCGEGFKVENNVCLLENMGGIIATSDGERVMYIKDRNVGAEISRGLEIYQIEDLMYDMCEVTFDEEYSSRCQFSEDVDCNDYVTHAHYNCSPEFYEQVSNIVGGKITTEQGLKNYIKDYKLSFGNYYFRGNNSGTNYTELKFEDESDDSLITNMSELDPKFLEGGKLGDSEGDGWIEGNEQDNPCDAAKGEYLPTPEDWKNLMEIWAKKNGYDLSNQSPFGPQHGEYSLEALAMDSAGGLFFPKKSEYKFMQDMLIPGAGMINYVHSSCKAEEGENCDEMYYRNGQPSLWMAQDKNGYVGAYQGMGIFYDTVDNNVDEGINDVAVPVRCFVNVPEVLVITLESDGRVYKELNVIKGDTLSEPSSPDKSNYTFDGWYTETGEKYDFNIPFETDMTLVAHWTREESSTGGYSGGGGSSSSKSIKSHNSADEADKTVLNDEKSKGDNDEPKKEVVQPNQGKTLDADTTSKETFNAHQWAYSKGLTKYRTSGEARMDDPLNRSEMAKISSIFAEQFLDKLPNDKKQEFCSQYPDLWKVEDDMKFFIIESCKLGYMGYESNGVDALAKFRPYTPVTVAEAATILSRIVWGNDNAMNGKDWYKGHLYATYNHGLIDDIKDPTKRSITRREAYLMLYRLINTKN